MKRLTLAQFLVLAALWTSGLRAAAQVTELEPKNVKGEWLYAYTFETMAGPAYEWFLDWTEDKKLVLLQEKEGALKTVATYDLKPDFYNIEAGAYAVKFKGVDRPLFIFALNHGAPYTTFYLVDPRSPSSVKKALKIESDEYTMAFKNGVLKVDYTNTETHLKKLIEIRAKDFGI